MFRRGAFSGLILGAILTMGTFGAAVFADDPSARVARIAFLSGPVSFRPATVDDWGAASINYPITTGDNLWTDAGGRAELQMGATSIRLSANTSLSVLNIDDRVTQLQIAQGTASVTVRSLRADEVIEVDLPNGAVSLNGPGFYRFDIPETGDRSTVTVRHGQAQIDAGRVSSTLYDGQSVSIVDPANPTVQLEGAPRSDAWEDWCQARDRGAANVAAAQYVSTDMVGYQDLDQSGVWQDTPTYGRIWVPRVATGWAPYRFGRWVWVEPWGWTWVDDAPWGFAPFHYGRWVMTPVGWAWVPGDRVARPVYAPALVVFAGGMELSITGAPVGWFPLGPHEPFAPAYHVSPAYVHAVNVSHVDVTVVNVTNVTYVNRAVPGGMTVVSKDVFIQGRPVAPAASVVSVDVVRRSTVVTAAPVAPVQASIVGQVGRGAAPPSAVVNRQVWVKTPPPPAPVPFAARQQALAAHPGQPVDEQTLHALQVQRPPQPATAHAAFRVATPSPNSPSRVVAAPSVPAPSLRETPPQSRTAPAAADIAARQAGEQKQLDSRHASEQQQLQARQKEEEKKAPNPRARQQIQKQHDQEKKNLDQKQSQERLQMEKRQEDEKRQPPPDYLD